jgi:hypothetical protein
MSQKCNTLLCGKEAVYKHNRSGELKCVSCRDKRGDRYSLAWTAVEAENSDGFLEIPPAKAPEPAHVVKRAVSGEYCVLFVEDEIAIYTCCSEEEAKKVCGALNTAFKFGAESVLHKLNSFSLDQRRNFGIMWGNNSMNANN